MRDTNLLLFPNQTWLDIDPICEELLAEIGRNVYRGKDIEMQVTGFNGEARNGETLLRGSIFVPEDYFSIKLLAILRDQGLSFTDFVRSYLLSTNFLQHRSVRSRLMQYGLVPEYDVANITTVNGGVVVPTRVFSLNPHITVNVPETFSLETFCIVAQQSSVIGEELIEVAPVICPQARVFQNGHGEVLSLPIERYYSHLQIGVEGNDLGELLSLESHFDRAVLDLRLGLTPMGGRPILQGPSYQVAGTNMCMPDGYCAFVLPDYQGAIHLPSLYLGTSLPKEHRWEFLGNTIPESVHIKVYRKLPNTLPTDKIRQHES